MDVGKLVRKTALVVCILFYVGLLTTLGMMGNWAFFITFVGIGLVVGVGEIVNNFWGYGKTLSTEYKHTLAKGGKVRAYGYIGLACLLLAITALAVHLGYYW